jgi:MFS family permease
VRAKLEETPAFESEVSHGEVPRTPLKTLLTNYRKELLQVFFAALISAIGTTFAVFALSFSRVMEHPVSTSTVLWSAIIGNLVAIFLIPLYANISDRIGRRPVFIAGNILCAIGVWFFLWSFTTGSDALVFVIGVLLGGVAYSITNAVWPATYAERFPTQVRLSGMAIGTQFGFAMAGFAPLIEAALMGQFNTASFVMPSVFASLVCIVSAVSIYSMSETYNVPFESLGLPTERAQHIWYGKPAVAYWRTSSAANVGADKDSEQRQRKAIADYAKTAGYAIVEEFYDAAVSGADPVHTRPGFAATLKRIEGNGVKTILVETANRFARDIMVQETG